MGAYSEKGQSWSQTREKKPQEKKVRRKPARIDEQ
jgi:hypothetical protein